MTGNAGVGREAAALPTQPVTPPSPPPARYRPTAQQSREPADLSNKAITNLPVRLFLVHPHRLPDDIIISTLFGIVPRPDQNRKNPEIIDRLITPLLIFVDIFCF